MAECQEIEIPWNKQRIVGMHEGIPGALQKSPVDSTAAEKLLGFQSPDGPEVPFPQGCRGREEREADHGERGGDVEPVGRDGLLGGSVARWLGRLSLPSNPATEQPGNQHYSNRHYSPADVKQRK